MLAFLGNVGVSETLLVIVVAIVVFGGRLPEVARDVMRVVYKVRRSFDDIRSEIDLGGEFNRIRRDLEHSVEPLPPRGRIRGGVQEPRVVEEEGSESDEDASRRTPP